MESDRTDSNVPRLHVEALDEAGGTPEKNHTPITLNNLAAKKLKTLTEDELNEYR